METMRWTRSHWCWKNEHLPTDTGFGSREKKTRAILESILSDSKKFQVWWCFLFRVVFSVLFFFYRFTVTDWRLFNPWSRQSIEKKAEKFLAETDKHRTGSTKTKTSTKLIEREKPSTRLNRISTSREKARATHFVRHITVEKKNISIETCYLSARTKSTSRC